MKSTIGLLLSILLAAAAAGQPAPDATSSGRITDIDAFLARCPSSDPALPEILRDFELRRDGIPAALPPCSEPVSQLSVAQYTDELIVVQGLRVIYAMDRGQSGHLPWTAGTLFDWMKSKIGGINIISGGGGGGSCCSAFGGRVFLDIGSQNDFNREFDKKWIGIAGNIDLYAHETRHVDGFPHSSCCGIPNGCDDRFDPANLSPYAIQWWLNKLWLDGTINVGMGCMIGQERFDAIQWFSGALNSQFRSRFCSGAPSIVSTPSQPGGACARARRRAVGRH